MTPAQPSASSPKTVIVTGANRGIGHAVARQLALRGCRVVLVARDPVQGAAALRELSALRSGEVQLVVGDLGDNRGVRLAAEAIEKVCPRIDVLIHNAGLWPSRRELNDDGVERAFAVNHLAPFLLNHLLEPKLVAARARVVQVSAGLYIKGKPDPERTARGEDFHALGTYPTTKLCNLLMMPRFAARWRDSGVTLNAVHPGVIRTNLGDRGGVLGAVLRVVKRLWKTPEQGPRPVVRLAIEPQFEGVTGRYFHEEQETPLAPVALDAATAERLWAQAERLTGVGGAR